MRSSLAGEPGMARETQRGFFGCFDTWQEKPRPAQKRSED